MPNVTFIRPLFASTAIAMAVAGSATAEDANGTISEWSGGTADVMVWEIGAPPEIIGSIEDDGTLTLDFPETMDAKQPLSKVFGCSGDSVTSTDPEAKYFITSSALIVGSVAEEKLKGSLVAATNHEAAAARAAMGTIAEGRYYQWIYTPDTVTIEGVCLSDVFPDGKTRIEVKTDYAMALEPGWNILEVDIDAVETPDEGFAVARDRTFRTVDALPSETQWFYWPEPE